MLRQGAACVQAAVSDPVGDRYTCAEPGGGAGTSTVQVLEAGEASTFEAASVARTSKVCAPFARFE